MASLYQLTNEYAEALAILADPELPPEVVQDTLEALQGELSIKGANVAAYALNLEAEADMIKQAEERLSKRRKAIEAKASKMREYLKDCMERAGINKIEALDKTFTASIGKPRASVVVDDVLALPDDLCTIKREASKTAIKKAIDSGIEVNGAHLEWNAPLSIK